jgi:ethanolamine utilization microcompartment shell protein EutS
VNKKAQKEATVNLMQAFNGYQALLPWLDRFENELMTNGKLSAESQAQLQKCVKALHEVDRFTERLYK